MKKRVFAMLIACLLLLTACGAPTEESVPVETPEAVEVSAPVEAPEEPEEPAVEEIPEASTGDGAVGSEIFDEPAAPTAEDALAFVDRPLSELTAALGEPVETYYEYSCSGPGDDGLLTYDGFVVFTYREPDGSAETVIDAEAQ